MIHGLKHQINKYNRKGKSYILGWKTGRKPVRQCVACSKGHPIWSCEKFKSMNIHERWKVPKQHQLRYRCLSFKVILVKHFPEYEHVIWIWL